MLRLRAFSIIEFLLFAIAPQLLHAQGVNIDQLFVDLTIVEKEEAAAKEVRLKWISRERDRIRGEIEKYEDEIAELRSIVPDPTKPRVLPRGAAEAQKQEMLAFNNWAANNNPALNVAVLRGSGINALLRVLGPIAHARKLRLNGGQAHVHFPSLSAANAIPVTEVHHYRLVPATSAGSNVVIRLNRLPLDLQWPPILIQEWPVECRDVLKLRDEYVTILNQAGGSDTKKLVDRAEVLDSALELLQVMVLKKKRLTPHNVSLSAQKRTQVHRDLQDAIRYLETVRATAERFKKAPSDFRVHEFGGGSIEEFLDFCYTHGMIFQGARPDDEADYVKTYRRMQDYARDVQSVENWKDDLQRRISELNAEDKKLVWQAAEQ